MNNIFMENRGIIEDIARRNVTPEGGTHADGMVYEHIGMDVASSMFVSDLRSGANLYYPLYPMGLAERLKGIEPAELARMSKEFSDLYR